MRRTRPWLHLATGLLGTSLVFAQSMAGVQPPADSTLVPRAKLAWGNDQLYLENGDDLGFTNDLALEAHLLDTKNDFALNITHRLITERFGYRRTDELTGRLRWLRDERLGNVTLSVGPAVTLALSGNFGGATLQNSWHQAVDNAYTFDHGLAHEYPDYRMGFVPSILFGVTSEPWWWLRLASGAEFGAALGRTGRGRALLYNGLELESGPVGFRLALSFGVDYQRVWTRDPFLELPGAYDTERVWVSPYFRLAARSNTWEAGYRAITNMGGAETQFGMLYLLVGGGPAFRHEHAQR